MVWGWFEMVWGWFEGWFEGWFGVIMDHYGAKLFLVFIDSIMTSYGDITYEIDKKTLKPDESAILKMYVNTSKIKGINARHIDVSLIGYTEKQRFSIISEVIEYKK